MKNRLLNKKEIIFCDLQGDKSKKHRGFTLVELIVVIVILAILAAILIPGLLRWIDKAREKRYELEARSIYLATEASLAKAYVWGFEGSVNQNVVGKIDGMYTITAGNPNAEWLAYIKEMSGIDTITWMRIYAEDTRIKALNIDYTSPADNKSLKAWWCETGYNNNEEDFRKWKSTWDDDGMWHFAIQ